MPPQNVKTPTAFEKENKSHKGALEKEKEKEVSRKAAKTQSISFLFLSFSFFSFFFFFFFLSLAPLRLCESLLFLFFLLSSFLPSLSSLSAFAPLRETSFVFSLRETSL